LDNTDGGRPSSLDIPSQDCFLHRGGDPPGLAELNLPIFALEQEERRENVSVNAMRLGCLVYGLEVGDDSFVLTIELVSGVCRRVTRCGLVERVLLAELKVC
jgi:hypothetical protein